MTLMDLLPSSDSAEAQPGSNNNRGQVSHIDHDCKCIDYSPFLQHFAAQLNESHTTISSVEVTGEGALNYLCSDELWLGRQFQSRVGPDVR